MKLDRFSTEAILREIATRDDVASAASKIGGRAIRRTCACGSEDFGELQMALPIGDGLAPSLKAL